MLAVGVLSALALLGGIASEIVGWPSASWFIGGGVLAALSVGAWLSLP